MPRRLPLREVAVGLILHDHRVLLIRRPPHGPLPNRWEFPGGKVEPGETPEGALRRELREEVGLTVGPLEPALVVRHDYDHIRVRLHAFRGHAPSPCVRLDGPATFRWIAPADLSALDLLPGSAPFVRWLRLATD